MHYYYHRITGFPIAAVIYFLKPIKTAKSGIIEQNYIITVHILTYIVYTL